MTDVLSETGYRQTKRKLRRLQERLGALEVRTDIGPAHLAAVRRSYQQMMRQYAREMKIYEANRNAEAGSAMRSGRPMRKRT